MNMHISISIRNTTAVPRNITLVISIIAIAIRSDEDASDITHLSISHTVTKAGINENMLNANTEETENQWSKKMSDLMKEINQKRKELLIQEDLFLICSLDYYLTVCEN